MDNITRRQLLELTKRAQQQGFKGSVMDVFKNPQILQQEVEVAATPQQQMQGLRGRDASQLPGAMVFPNVSPNTPFNTVGMKAPINIQKYDEQGHLVKSYENVPPGVKSLPTGPRRGTVIETPTQRQYGGIGPIRTDGPRVPAMSDAEMSLKIIQEANAGNPAARRMRTDYGQRMYLPGETDPSTHYMASFDKYAVPLVQEEYIGGPLTYSENPPPSSSDFRFNTPEEAAYFGSHYKDATAAKVFKNYKTGGGVSNRYLTGGLKKRAKQNGGVDYRLPSIRQMFDGVPMNTLIEVDPKTGEELAYVDANYMSFPPQPMDYNTLLHRQAFQESSFRDAVITGKKKSSAGAMGLAQFMPNTITELKRLKFVDDSFDPYDTAQAAAAQRKYMDWLAARPYLAKGNAFVQQAKVLAAYNRGPDVIKDVLTQAKKDGYDIYESTDWINHPSMPKETREYVENILLKESPRYERDYESVKDKYRDLYFKQTGGYKALLKY